MILRNTLIEVKLIEQIWPSTAPTHHRRLQGHFSRNQRNHCSRSFSSLF